MIQYTHRYSLTAADMDTRYRMTPTAVHRGGGRRALFRLD